MARGIELLLLVTASTLVAVACAQGEPLTEDSSPSGPGPAQTGGAGGAEQPGAGGQPAASGGSMPIATGGASPSPPATGGATPGSGGTTTGSGGAAPGTGGAPPTGTGGSAPGTGGAPSGSGGANGTGGSPDFDRCVALTVDNACTRCTCGACQAEAFACGATSDTAKNAACKAIIDCGMTQHCTNIACYCGSSSDCTNAPTGACVKEIQAAAGTTDLTTIANDLSDATHPIHLANAVGDCAKQNCAGTCGL